MITHILDVPVSKLPQNYVRIENLKQYLITVEHINPVDLGRYIPYWRRIKQIAIEGMWGEESSGYRYMPGDLLFYGNFCVIQRTNAAKITEPIKPLVRDLDLELSYGLFVAGGFSGFSEDEQFTSDKLLFEYLKHGIPDKVHEEMKIRHLMLFNSQGKLKEYIDPLAYLKRTHSKPLGKPLYYNEACNFSILGARSGGKSYYVALGKALHAIVTDGIKYYDADTGKCYKDPLYREEYLQPIAEVMVGSGNSDKSSEFASKMQFAMNQFGTNPDFGVWGKESDSDYTPSPFFKQMVGSIGPNNKENPWRHEYSVIDKGREVKKGSKSKLYHVSYFEQKAQGKGSQAGAGGRVLLSIVEESGLCFGKDTEIRMHDGSVMKIQYLSVGDTIMGDDGSPRKILSLASGSGALYKVQQQLGQSYIISENHPICVKKKFIEKGVKKSKYDLIPAKYFKNEDKIFGYKLYGRSEKLTNIKVSKISNGEHFGFTLEGGSYFQLKDGTICHNTSNTVEIHNSNKFVVSRDGIQFGVQIDLGTSGNISAVQQTKKKFMNPFDYDILPYDDPEELGQNGKIGFFLPTYLTLNYCKDEDGNTDYQKAFAEVLRHREAAAKSTDPSVLREEKMNRPILPSEMWISKQGYYLPYDEAVLRQKALSKNGLFRDLGTPVKLIWDSKQPYGVLSEPEFDLQPYYNFPIESDRMTKEAPVVIYEHPIFINGEIPQGMYFSVYDPYVSDNLEDGGSLGTTFIMLDPLYWDEYLTDKGPIVATYIAKHADGLDGYHEVQEKLLAYYGNQDNAHYYEKNRGRSCRDYYMKKGKAFLLGLQPGTYASSSSVAKRVVEYGINVPNGPGKILMLDETSDWLKSEFIMKNGDIKRVIEVISCKFTVDQIVDFSMDKADNYDAVSTLIMIPTVIKERQFYITEKVTSKNKSNPLKFLTSNERLWSQRI